MDDAGIMKIEESWIDSLEKMQVSKLVKNYIVSIDEEVRDYFEKTITNIQERTKVEIFSSPLVSGNYILSDIMEDEMRKFSDSAAAVVDYYVDGIYHCGKTSSRSKLKLSKQKPLSGERYYFTHKDQMFIDGYKSVQVGKIRSSIDYVTFKLIQDFIKFKLNGKWIDDGDDDYVYLDYKGQEFSEEDIQNVFQLIEKTFSPIYEYIMDEIIREIIVLFQRAQIEEFCSLGINIFTTFADDDERCCPICSVKSGKILKLEEIVDGQFGVRDGIEHALCKYAIEPVISYRDQITSVHFMSELGKKPEDYAFSNYDAHLSADIVKYVDVDFGIVSCVNVPIEMEKRLKSLMSHVKIYYGDFLTKKEIIFRNDISNVSEWVDSVKDFYMEKGNSDFQATNLSLKDQDNLTNQIASFNTNDKIFISSLSFDSQPIEHLVLREIFRNNIKVSEDVKKIYEDKIKTKKVAHGVAIYKDPFVSYLAEDSPFDYLLESLIFYVAQSNKLKYVDEKIYNYIKENLNSIFGEKHYES